MILPSEDRILAESFAEFLHIANTGSGDDVNDWMKRHVVSDATGFQFLWFCTHMAASMMKLTRPDIPVERIVIQREGVEDIGALRAFQLLVMMLRDDHAGATGLITGAISEHSQVHMASLILQVIRNLRQASDDLEGVGYVYFGTERERREFAHSRGIDPRRVFRADERMSFRGHPNRLVIVTSDGWHARHTSLRDEDLYRHIERYVESRYGRRA